MKSAITKQEWKFISFESGLPATMAVATFRATSKDAAALAELRRRLAADPAVRSVAIDALGFGHVIQRPAREIGDDALKKEFESAGAVLNDLARAEWPVTPARYEIVLERLDAAGSELAWKTSREVEKVLWAEIDPAAARITIVLTEPCSQIEARSRAALEAAGFAVKEFRAL